MNRRSALLVLSLAIAGCAHQQGDTGAGVVGVGVAAVQHGEPALAPFSSNSPTGLPSGWEPLIILKSKKPTEYRLAADGGRTVLYARAASASSGLMHEVSIDPFERPWINWQWKVKQLIKTADNTERTKEDSPVRIVLGFDGDKDSLPFSDQIMFETAKLLTGRDVPYATLMYIWENKAPVGTVIANSRSGRFKKIVAASGANGVGQWREFTRNIVEDYQRAFGEKPGKLIGIGVLTDTDNTGETAEAWYGDIQLLGDPPMTQAWPR